MATVTLNWNAPLSGGPVDSYKIYRKQGTNQTESAIRAYPDSGFPVERTKSALTSGTGYQYQDTTLSSGDGSYCWTVTALNSTDESLSGADPTHQTL